MQEGTGMKLMFWGIGAVVVLVLVVAMMPFTVIGQGQMGVITRNGALNRTVGAGLHAKMPIFENVTKFDVQTQKEQVDANAASSDLQEVNTTVALNYNVMPDRVGDLYSRIGTNYKQKIIDPAIQEAVKAATAKFTANDLLQKRPEVSAAIQNALTQRLSLEDIQVSAVSIVNFSFSESFTKAIETKVTAEQTALAAKNQLETVKYEAEQRIAQAKGEAEAIRIQAEAITQQGGREYVALKQVEKWDGHACTQYCGTDLPMPLLNVK